MRIRRIKHEYMPWINARVVSIGFAANTSWVVYRDNAMTGSSSKVGDWERELDANRTDSILAKLLRAGVQTHGLVELRFAQGVMEATYLGDKVRLYHYSPRMIKKPEQYSIATELVA